MTGLIDDNKESTCDITNIGDWNELRSSDIINYLKNAGVEIMKINETYETIMTLKNDSKPIIIEYTVSRHTYEDVSLPRILVQFCLLVKKENLILPFNSTGRNIKLGTQFNSCTWKNSFNEYTRKSLDYKIAPVAGCDTKSLTALVRTLDFYQSWWLYIPTK